MCLLRHFSPESPQLHLAHPVDLLPREGLALADVLDLQHVHWATELLDAGEGAVCQQLHV